MAFVDNCGNEFDVKYIFEFIYKIRVKAIAEFLNSLRIEMP